MAKITSNEVIWQGNLFACFYVWEICFSDCFSFIDISCNWL